MLMITWASIITWKFFFYIDKYLFYDDVLRKVSVGIISSRILFLCVLNEIIMNVKLNKI
jgi:hypothetical protein